MKRFIMKFAIIAIAAAAVLVTLPVPKADAKLPYFTSSTDANGRWIPSPNAFVPWKIWEGFKNPEDLFIMPNDDIYVADRGNDRIVHLDSEGKQIRVIPAEGTEDKKIMLRGPEGVFVTEEGDIYVADTGNKRIVVYDKDGRFVKEILAPKSELIPDNYLFVPVKAVVDNRGYVFVSNKGGYQGLLQLTPEGEFAGFFGANKVPSDWLERLKRRYYTEEQLAEEQKNLPGAITNMTMDSRGFIYTVNRNLPTGQLKRLNAGGNDLLGGKNFAPWVGKMDRFSFLDVAVDENDVMTVVESAGGRIYQYDWQGNMLFRFGNDSALSPRFGLFKRPTSVVVNSQGDIFVADGEQSVIQSFKRTEFGTMVHQALALFKDGKYEEGSKMWRQILVQDGTFDRAYQAIAKAEYKEENYEAAMGNFEKAYDRTGYSESFWQIRMNWLLDYFGWFMTAVIGIWLLATGWFIYRKRRGKNTIAKAKEHGPWMTSLRAVFDVLRHPIAGMYEIANNRDIRFGFAAILLILGFVVTIAGKAAVSFVFAAQRFNELNLWVEAGQYFLLWLGWLMANYLIGSVMKGEGTLKKVFIVNAYALVPLVLFTLPVQLLSNIMTQQEGVIYAFAMSAIQFWVLALIFIGTLHVHNYNMKETIGMTLVSIVTLACLGLFGFLAVGLLYQAADFFIQLGRELMNRA
ncbi:YIP1 family protein [Paenibacillus spongiae]|uniref:YIP1 family protein n=1 Tax=Paenibacillus spongiae TaxID=2909671 RepID=A0ABY5S0Y2_9BACL|nr:YIP1 family protein [Paenibacillus spongiae]UVI27517.1 YIP1 family protein [Paenibacillus spongiae]